MGDWRLAIGYWVLGIGYGLEDARGASYGTPYGLAAL